MIIFKIFGVVIRIDFFFLAFLAVIFSIKYYKLAFLVITASVIHELVHIIFLYIYGGRLSEVEFLGLGIMMKANGRETVSRRRDAIIALSAPIFNILLGCAVLFSGGSWFGYINIAIGLWNILPIKGLDGATLKERTLS
ncbi:MAG: metalloprotease family protein [Ruminococcus sp.]|jgi:hypothetical protein|nr:metalloprotease family protein [Ruminococcus sp.]